MKININDRTLAILHVLKDKYEQGVFCIGKEDHKRHHNYNHLCMYNEMIDLGISRDSVKLSYDDGGYASISVRMPSEIHSINGTITLNT